MGGKRNIKRNAFTVSVSKKTSPETTAGTLIRAILDRNMTELRRSV